MPQSRRIDVAALGELVVDLIPARAADGSACLAPKPGGAPANVAVGVARLGGHASMLGKVGDDAFGRLLIETLTANGVATEAVLTTRAGNTPMAVVTVAPDGEREFLIYRKNSADFDLRRRRRRGGCHSFGADPPRRKPMARRANLRGCTTPCCADRARSGRARLS